MVPHIKVWTIGTWLVIEVPGHTHFWGFHMGGQGGDPPWLQLPLCLCAHKQAVHGLQRRNYQVSSGAQWFDGNLLACTLAQERHSPMK